MKKLLLILSLAGGIAFSSFAQTTNTSKTYGGASIGIDAALPTGDASQVYNFGIGGSIKYDAPLGSNVYFTLSGGYEAFFVKSIFKDLGARSTDGYVPLKGGLKFYLSGGFFGEAQAGISIYTGDGGFTAFAYSPGIGYSFDKNLELGVRYEAWVKEGTMGQAALRLAYRFK